MSAGKWLGKASEPDPHGEPAVIEYRYRVIDGYHKSYAGNVPVSDNAYPAGGTGTDLIPHALSKRAKVFARMNACLAYLHLREHRDCGHLYRVFYGSYRSVGATMEHELLQ